MYSREACWRPHVRQEDSRLVQCGRLYKECCTQKTWVLIAKMSATQHSEADSLQRLD